MTRNKGTLKKFIILMSLALTVTLIPQFAFADVYSQVDGTQYQAQGQTVPENDTDLEPEPEPMPPTRAELLCTPVEKTYFSSARSGNDSIDLYAYGSSLNATYSGSPTTATQVAFLLNPGYGDTDIETAIDSRIYPLYGTGSQRNTASFYCLSYPNGIYNLSVKEYFDGKWIIASRPVPIIINDGQVKILVYNTIVENNKTKQTTPNVSTNTDKIMYDLRTMVYDNPVTRSYVNPSISYASYYKTVSDEIVRGAYSDYDKMKKIFVYVASNLYYDKVGLQTKIQYDNPYLNLKKIRNGTDSPNSKDGKVSTTCNGYSAMVMALGRAQGIPCRMVYGYKCDGEWLAEKITLTKNHYWAEAYISSERRWITIDATNATSSSWNSKTDTWIRYDGCDRYSTFDIPDESLANRYYIRGYCAATEPAVPSQVTKAASSLVATIKKVSDKRNAEAGVVTSPRES